MSPSFPAFKFCRSVYGKAIRWFRVYLPPQPAVVGEPREKLEKVNFSSDGTTIPG
jgi:hypothetical protein